MGRLSDLTLSEGVTSLGRYWLLEGRLGGEDADTSVWLTSVLTPASHAGLTISFLNMSTK